MTPERLRQIEELYNEARDATADERVELLAQADPELCREVESLLEQGSADDFLDRPAFKNAPQLLEDATLTELARALQGWPLGLRYAFHSSAAPRICWDWPVICSTTQLRNHCQ